MTDPKARKLELLRKKQSLIKFNKLKYYDPYPFQVEFHNDEDKRKGLRAGNQIGKTICGTVQDAFDLTGLYPDWYKGHRFEKPVNIVCGSINNDKTRDLLQKALCGDPVDKFNTLGTGWLPKNCLDKNKISLKRGVTDAFTHIKVKHHTNGVFDGWSNLSFSSYESGKEAWMGDTVDVYHGDEEPPMDILGQMGRGCIASKGFIRLTWTPENGRTDVVIKVENEWSLHTAEWKDASGEDFTYEFEDGESIEFDKVETLFGKTGHITRETITQAEKDNLPYMMKMRMKGIPVMGTGLVFTHQEQKYKTDPIPIPDHWPRLDAIDFGGLSSTSHPTAFVRLAHDLETDTIYIYDGFRVIGKEIPEVAAQIVMKPHTHLVPVEWPHDGNKTLGQGGTTKEQYMSAGVNMLRNHFTNPPEEYKEEGTGGIQILPGVTEMSARMNDGRLKVFSTVLDFFDEVRNYHMKDGKIVDREDDFMAASRVGVMGIRHAIPVNYEPVTLNHNNENVGFMWS